MYLHFLALDLEVKFVRIILKAIRNIVPYAIALEIIIAAVSLFTGGGLMPSDPVAMTAVKAAETAQPTDTARVIEQAVPDVKVETAVMNVPVQTEAHQTAPQEEPDPEPAQQPAATSPYADLVNQLSAKDIDVLTRLVYHESRGEGGNAVIEVVFNRILDNRFPDTLQGVVYEKNQFEPAPNLYNWAIKEPDAYAKCEQEVQAALSPNYEPILPSYYVFFNNFGAGSTEDYFWLGGNVFFGEYTLGF